MRDFLKFVELGKGKRDIHRGYDMMSSEMFFLMDKFASGEYEIFDVIVSAYYAGLESGFRMGKKHGK